MAIFLDITSPSNPLAIFLIQVILTLLVTRIVGRVLQHFNQPPSVGEILGGIILGPTILGQIPNYLQIIWPEWSMGTFDVVSTLGLIFLMFLMGLQLNGGEIKKSYTIGTASILFPFGVGVGLSFVLADYNEGAMTTFEASFIIFLGTIFSFTAFPILGGILDTLGYLHTDLGKMALQIASFNDILGWYILAVASTFSSNSDLHHVGYIFLILVLLVLLNFLILKPCLFYLHKFLFLENDGQTDPSFQFVLIVLMFGQALLTHEVGVHAFFGAFLTGLIVPKSEGNLNELLIPRFELITKTFLIPLWNASSGIKTNINALTSLSDFGILVILFIVAFLAKFVPTFLSIKYIMKDSSWRYRASMGVLLNAKGLVELIALNVGYSQNIINLKLFTMFVLITIVSTIVVGPLTKCIFDPEYAEMVKMKSNIIKLEGGPVRKESTSAINYCKTPTNEDGNKNDEFPKCLDTEAQIMEKE